MKNSSDRASAFFLPQKRVNTRKQPSKHEYQPVEDDRNPRDLVNVRPADRGSGKERCQRAAVGDGNQRGVACNDARDGELALDDAEHLGHDKHHHKPEEEHRPHAVARADGDHRAVKRNKHF